MFPETVYPGVALKGPHETRLLELFPGCGTELIRCKLQHYMINEPQQQQKYEAVSYEWGSPGQYAFIELNGVRYRIQANLFTCLKVLHRSNLSRVLWADAICINQGDILERNHQVQIMRAIFEGAEMVLSWLGPAADNSDLLFDFHVELLEHGFKGMEHWRAGSEQSEQNSFIINLLDMISVYFRDHIFEVYDALTALQNRSYWTRIWIVSEVIHAKNILLLCGDKSISWDDMDALMSLWTRRIVRINPTRPYSKASKVFSQVHDFRSTQADSDWSLRELLEAFGDCECSEIHDRVYALLETDTNFKRDCTSVIDYECCLEELYFDVLYFCLSTESSSLDAIAFCKSLQETLGLSARQCYTWAREMITKKDKARCEKLQILITEEILLQQDIITPAAHDPVRKLLALVTSQEVRLQTLIAGEKDKISEPTWTEMKEAGAILMLSDDKNCIWTPSDVGNGDITYSFCNGRIVLIGRKFLPLTQAITRKQIDESGVVNSLIGVGLCSVYENLTSRLFLQRFGGDALRSFMQFGAHRDFRNFLLSHGCKFRLSCIDLVIISLSII